MDTLLWNSFLNVFKVVNAKEEAILKGHVVRAPRYNVFNLRKIRIYSNTTESITFIPGELTTLHDLGFPRTLRKYRQV